MSQAYDLAVSVCLGVTSTPGIVHDPASPLVVGSPQTGEFLVWTYDPITHTADLQVASDVLNLVSILSFAADGNLLINGQPIASTGNIDQAVADAQAAAAAAEASAEAAAAAVISVNQSKALVDATVADFDITSTDAINQTAANAERAETAVNNAESIRTAAAGSADTALRAASEAQASALESQNRASADPSFIFDDGTKSARGYAAEAAQSATLSRAAKTRPLGAAGLPETFVPGMLFTRARCENTTAGIVNIGPNIWTDLSGEAWATYRLEKTGGSIRFVGAGGTTTITAPGLISSAPTFKARGPNPVLSSNSLIATCTPPVGFTGRVVIMAMYSVNNGVAYTFAPSFSGGIALVTRRAAISPGEADFSAQGVVYEGSITDWPGGDLQFSAVITPGVLYFFTKPLLITGGDLALPPIINHTKSTAAASSNNCALAAVPAQSLVLGMAFQRRPTAVFSSFGSNLSPIEAGNLLGAGPAPPAIDTNDFRNGAYGIGQGIAAGTGTFTIAANYNAAVDKIATMGVAYPPGTGEAASVVDMTFAGGRDTLTEVGAEAEVWFNPDGRTVFVQIPK